MSDKKPVDSEILLKHTNEESDQRSTMQEEFDALLSEEKQRPSATEIDGNLSDNIQQSSITEVDGKLSTLHASDFAMNAPSSTAKLVKNMDASFGDHTIIVVGDHTVIIEEAESDKIVTMGKTHRSKPKASSRKSIQHMMEADVLQHGKSPASENDSALIEPRAFAEDISPADVAAFEAMGGGKLKGTASSDTPDNDSKATAPLKDAKLFSSMQNDFDTFKYKASDAESFPEWEPMPAEPPAESMAEQTSESAPEESPSAQQASDSDEPENETASAESFPEWEPMPAEPPAESMAEQTSETAPEETPSAQQASDFDEPENETASTKNTEHKRSWYTEPLTVMSRKVRALNPRHTVKSIFNKLPEWKPIAAEPPADTSSEHMAEQISEAAPEETPPPRSSREMWGGILFIVCSLAAISLVLWQIVEPIINEDKLATHTPDNIQSPRPTTQTQAVTAEQPTQISGKQVRDTSNAGTGEAGIQSLAFTAGNEAGVLKAETALPAKQTVKATMAAVITEEETQPVAALSSEPPAAPAAKPAMATATNADNMETGQQQAAVVTRENIATKELESVASAKPAPAVSDTAGGNENWAVALSSVDSEKTAIQQQARLRATGIEAEYIRSIKNGNTWFFILIDGFSNKQEAEKQGGILAEKLNTQVSWINIPENTPE